MARLVAELPHELLGLGGLGRVSGNGDAARELERQVATRLAAAHEQLEEVRRALAAARPQCIRSELARAGVRPGRRGLRLALTGERRMEGWINVGAHPSGVMCDLSAPLPFESCSAARVYFAMAIEHFSMGVAARILREVHRVLEPGGILRVVTQDTAQYLHAYVARDQPFFDEQRRWWELPAAPRPLLQHVLAWTGAPRAPDDFFEHKYAYDEESLTWLLVRAGFRDVVRSEYMESRHADLRVDWGSADAGAYHRGGYYGLFMEATR